MLFQQYDSKLKRYSLLGIGRVQGYKEYPAVSKTPTVTKSRHKKAVRVAFSVCTGHRLVANTKNEYVYQSVPCVFYVRDDTPKAQQAIALSLKRNDLVMFGGFLTERIIGNEQTGERKVWRECLVDMLISINAFGAGMNLKSSAQFDEYINGIESSEVETDSVDGFWDDFNKGE